MPRLAPVTIAFGLEGTAHHSWTGESRTKVSRVSDGILTFCPLVKICVPAPAAPPTAAPVAAPLPPPKIAPRPAPTTAPAAPRLAVDAPCDPLTFEMLWVLIC